jgi:hypothetical protein
MTQFLRAHQLIAGGNQTKLLAQQFSSPLVVPTLSPACRFQSMAVIPFAKKARERPGLTGRSTRPSPDAATSGSLQMISIELPNS